MEYNNHYKSMVAEQSDMDSFLPLVNYASIRNTLWINYINSVVKGINAKEKSLFINYLYSKNLEKS